MTTRARLSTGKAAQRTRGSQKTASVRGSRGAREGGGVVRLPTEPESTCTHRQRPLAGPAPQEDQGACLPPRAGPSLSREVCAGAGGPQLVGWPGLRWPTSPAQWKCGSAFAPLAPGQSGEGGTPSPTPAATLTPPPADRPEGGPWHRRLPRNPRRRRVPQAPVLPCLHRTEAAGSAPESSAPLSLVYFTHKPHPAGLTWRAPLPLHPPLVPSPLQVSAPSAAWAP